MGSHVLITLVLAYLTSAIQPSAQVQDSSLFVILPTAVYQVGDSAGQTVTIQQSTALINYNLKRNADTAKTNPSPPAQTLDGDAIRNKNTIKCILYMQTTSELTKSSLNDCKAVCSEKV